MKEFAKRFYKSKKWQKCRKAYIDKRVMLDGGMCEVCQEMPGMELHHVHPLSLDNINDPNITIASENLLWLCKDCHFKAHKELIMKSFEYAKKERVLTKQGVWFDENGIPHKQEIYIVHGAPASGKTTYVKEHKHHGDLVIDIDLIGQALAIVNKTSIPGNLWDTVIGVRDYLYGQIAGGHIDCKCVWVIAGLPKKKDREELCKTLGATLIHIKSDFNQCMEQMKSDEERTDKLKQEFIIRKYFENYEP